MRQKQRVFSLFLLSPSSRRAWIEISCGSVRTETKEVALLAEGVDRNALSTRPRPARNLSPSSRRAWIEMPFAAGRERGGARVALLAEGVDRNNK